VGTLVSFWCAFELLIPFLDWNGIRGWASFRERKKIQQLALMARAYGRTHTGLIRLETRAASVCENPPERVFSLQVVLGERAGVRVPALVAVSGG